MMISKFLIHARWIATTAVLAALANVTALSAQAEEADKLEGINRKVFYVNERLDHYVLRPVAVTYTKVIPDPLERGVDNFSAILVRLAMSSMTCCRVSLSKLVWTGAVF